MYIANNKISDFRFLKKLNSELEQSIIRLIACTILLIYTSLLYSIGEIRAFSIVAMYVASIPFCILYIIWTYLDQAINKKRLFLAMFVEVGTTTFALSQSGESGAPLIVVYFWLIFGNGLRHGSKYLFYHTALTIAGFIIVMFTSPFWSTHPYLSIGILLAMFVLPLYIGALLQRLHAAVIEAESANLAKSQFLANISHEIRTPLNGVIGMSEMLSTTELNQTQQEFTSTIQSSAKTLLALIEEILDFSKIEAGKIVIKNEEFDLYNTVRNVTKMLTPLAEKKGLGFRLHITADTPYCLYGDELHLRQILITLSSNAIKFTEHGSVEVNVSTIYIKDDYAHIRFEVTDTGIGISEEQQTNIFEMFTQANISISNRYGGTGLGTAIARSLVEEMGGRIGLVSNINKGSTFWFEIPFIHRNDIAPVKHQELIHNSRILLVATHGAIHKELTQYLLEWDLSWDHAITSIDAENLLLTSKNRRYDIIVVDDSGIDIESTKFSKALKSNPHTQKSYLVLLTDENYISHIPILDAGYFCILKTPIDKRLLYNTLHATSTPDKLQHNVTRLVNHNKSKTKNNLEILVGEDNPTNQKVIKKILEHAGYSVDIVNDGEEILDALENHDYDLIILDMIMPNMGGLETLRIYRFSVPTSKQIPVIILTANATVDASRECLEAGATAYLTKPIQSDKLINTIQSLPIDREIKPTNHATINNNIGINKLERSKVIDINVLDKLAELDDDINFMQELVNGFLKDSNNIVCKIKYALDKSDRLEIQDLTHALKGSARSIGAIALAQAASEIHDYANSINIPEFSEKYKNLTTLYNATEDSLLLYLEQLRSAAL